MKEFDVLDILEVMFILGVMFDIKMMFESFIAVTRAASVKLGILDLFCNVFIDWSLLVRSFRCSTLPVLEYCSTGCMHVVLGCRYTPIATVRWCSQ